MPTPYTPPLTGESAIYAAERRCLISKWLTVPVGFLAGGLIAAAASFFLALICLAPPLSHAFHLNGEFSGLLLIGLPVLAFPCGAIGGIFLGSTRTWRHGFTIAVCLGCLPAIVYFLVGAWQPGMHTSGKEQFISTGVSSVLMMLATIIGLRLTEWSFRCVERHRSK